jgi:predicted MarR family transcription regulator
MKETKTTRGKEAGTDTAASRSQGKGPIVSAAHLLSEGAELNEFEFGLIIASNAFNRWMVRCMTAAGGPDLGPLDILVLHQVNHRKRPKRLGDICFVLNVEDNHTVSYSLKKLVKLGLVQSERKGKEAFFGATDEGRNLCTSYRQVRDSCLVGSASSLGAGRDDISEIATLLRALSGLYDQAARAATSL